MTTINWNLFLKLNVVSVGKFCFWFAEYLKRLFCPFSKAGIKNGFIIFSLGSFNAGLFSFHGVIFPVPEIKMKGLIQVVRGVFSGNAVVKAP